MVVCGIKKYDDLPARIGWIDIDSLRFALVKADKDLKEVIERRQEILIHLEAHYKKYLEVKNTGNDTGEKKGVFR